MTLTPRLRTFAVALICIPLLCCTPVKALSEVNAQPRNKLIATIAQLIIEIIIKRIPEPINGGKIEGEVIETQLKNPKLIAAQSKLEIKVEDWNAAWYGSIAVKLHSKPTVNYIIDLSKIELNTDGKSVTLTIPKPVEIQVVSDNAPSSAEYSFLRKWFGADTRQALENKIRDECNTKAEAEAKKELRSIREDLQKNLEAEIESLLAKQGIEKVQVRIANGK